MTALATLKPVPAADAPSLLVRAATRPWMSIDLPALALAMDGTRPLPAGAAHLIAWGAAVPAPRRVPASAFVNVRRRVAPDAATHAGRAAEAAPAGSRVASLEAARTGPPPHPLRRGGVRVSVPATGMPRRHKLMLAAAAVVMALGFFGAGAGRVGQAASAAPTGIPATTG